MTRTFLVDVIEATVVLGSCYILILTLYGVLS